MLLRGTGKGPRYHCINLSPSPIALHRSQGLAQTDSPKLWPMMENRVHLKAENTKPGRVCSLTLNVFLCPHLGLPPNNCSTPNPGDQLRGLSSTVGGSKSKLAPLSCWENWSQTRDIHSQPALPPRHCGMRGDVTEDSPTNTHSQLLHGTHFHSCSPVATRRTSLTKLWW